MFKECHSFVCLGILHYPIHCTHTASVCRVNVLECLAYLFIYLFLLVTDARFTLFFCREVCFGEGRGTCFKDGAGLSKSCFNKFVSRGMIPSGSLDPTPVRARNGRRKKDDVLTTPGARRELTAQKSGTHLRFFFSVQFSRVTVIV